MRECEGVELLLVRRLVLLGVGLLEAALLEEVLAEGPCGGDERGCAWRATRTCSVVHDEQQSRMRMRKIQRMWRWHMRLLH